MNAALKGFDNKHSEGISIFDRFFIQIFPWEESTLLMDISSFRTLHKRLQKESF